MDSTPRRNRHSVFRLYYHVVLVTKYRHKCINEALRDDLIQFAGAVLEKMDAVLIEADGEADHLHLLIETMPSASPAQLVNSLKTVTSRLIRKKHCQYLKKYYWKPFFWEPSYFITTTGGAPLEMVKKYIENQRLDPA